MPPPSAFLRSKKVHKEENLSTNYFKNSLLFYEKFNGVLEILR